MWDHETIMMIVQGVGETLYNHHYCFMIPHILSKRD